MYQKAFNAAMTIFGLSKQFPAEERYSLPDQISPSSPSVFARLFSPLFKIIIAAL
uniref:four helix bundle protein n=1 Tax=Umezakia ovalisporum TaxID=75695 RepID=UPI0028CB4CB1|nr:four helix bundle protein [Umezakia ovalisporum]